MRLGVVLLILSGTVACGSSGSSGPTAAPSTEARTHAQAACSGARQANSLHTPVEKRTLVGNQAIAEADAAAKIDSQWLRLSVDVQTEVAGLRANDPASAIGALEALTKDCAPFGSASRAELAAPERADDDADTEQEQAETRFDQRILHRETGVWNIGVARRACSISLSANRFAAFRARMIVEHGHDSLSSAQHS